MKRKISAKDTRLAFIDQVVTAGLASREHAVRVVERNERSVIEAWRRQLQMAPVPTPVQETHVQQLGLPFLN